METLQDLVQDVRASLEREFPRRLRQHLMQQPKDWLVEQLAVHVEAPHVSSAPALSTAELEPAARMEDVEESTLLTRA